MTGKGRVRIFVSGRVQGVFYRAFARDEGRRLGLRGWVRNLSDGRVEILAEGDPEALKNFEQFCWKGSPYSHVDLVEPSQEPPGEEPLRPFDVKL